MPGYAAISGLVTGTLSGSVVIGPFTIAANVSADYSSQAVTLTSPGNTTIAIPSFAVGVILSPSGSNTGSLTLKGVGGDTGIPLAPNLPNLLSFGTGGATSLVITAGSGVTGLLQVIFF